MLIGICLMALCGCATPAPQKESKDASAPAAVVASAASEDSRLAIRNQGYSLLYELLDDEKNVSKLLIIKKEQSDVGDLIKKIADASGAAAKQMEVFSKSDP